MAAFSAASANPLSLEPARTLELLKRLALLALVCGVELILITLRVDTSHLENTGPVIAFVHAWGAWTLRAVVAFAVIFPALLFLQHETLVRNASVRLQHAPWLQMPAFTAHAIAIAVLLPLSGYAIGTSSSNFLAAAWIGTGLLAIGLVVRAFFPAWFLRELLAVSALPALYAACAAVIACAIGWAGWALWIPLARLTFSYVAILLKPFLSSIVANPATLELGSSTFHVQIAPECSGFEGAGLLLVFASLWLVLFRKEFRFPQALLLVPAAVLLLWLANGVRIAALILIGNAGMPTVATQGFHSQAGWIAFNLVALGFTVAASRTPWISKTRTIAAPADTRSDVATSAYLAPFLAILLAGMLARAASGDFEWFYPLRLFAAALALWWFRDSYKELNWRFGMPGVIAGVAIFAMWVCLERFSGTAKGGALGGQLAAWPPLLHYGWLAARMTAAVVTVPIAEELAFRGFLLRRLQAAHFDRLDFRKFAPLAFVLSSLGFGLMHGSRWIAGTLAGMAFAWAAQRKGRFGDAVAAHGLANALLAVWVLTTRNWNLW